MKKKCIPVMILFVIVGTIFLTRISFAQINEKNQELDSFFEKTIADYNYVALGACLIKNNTIVWQGSYGYADKRNQKKLSSDAIFNLASLSKTLTTTALMQLYEKGLFGLDDDVNKYVPMKIRNPNFPENPITIRMLLTHTSSFDDLLPNGKKLSLGVWGDSPIPFKEYVEELFTPGGKYYSTEFFSKTAKPGDKYAYSNISYSLIGYIVEKLSGMNFDEYCQQNIFKPLEMENTSWHLKGLDTGRVVLGYGFPPKDSISNYKEIKPFGEPGYPEGMLRTTMEDFSHFLIAMMNEGKYKNVQILTPETVKIIQTPQGIKNIESRSFRTIDMGLTWKIFDVEGSQLYSMNGFSGSNFANAYYSPVDKTGIIYFFTGITMQNMQGVFEITKKLNNTLKGAL